ncbi:MAG: hypothetical protein AAGF95_27780 [Chloroflexota bacterium]
MAVAPCGDGPSILPTIAGTTRRTDRSSPYRSSTCCSLSGWTTTPPPLARAWHPWTLQMMLEIDAMVGVHASRRDKWDGQIAHLSQCSIPHETTGITRGWLAGATLPPLNGSGTAGLQMGRHWLTEHVEGDRM